MVKQLGILLQQLACSSPQPIQPFHYFFVAFVGHTNLLSITIHCGNRITWIDSRSYSPTQPCHSSMDHFTAVDTQWGCVLA